MGDLISKSAYMSRQIMTCATGGGLGGEGVCFWGLKQRLWHYICSLLLCFPAGLLPLSYKFQLALPAVQVCFACGLLCLCCGSVVCSIRLCLRSAVALAALDTG